MSEPTAFPLDESKLPFKIPKDTKPREKIMKLGQMITDRVPAKLRRLTVEDPEYWGLASIVTDGRCCPENEGTPANDPAGTGKSHRQTRQRAGAPAVSDELRWPVGIQLGEPPPRKTVHSAHVCARQRRVL